MKTLAKSLKKLANRQVTKTVQASPPYFVHIPKIPQSVQKMIKSK